MIYLVIILIGYILYELKVFKKIKDLCKKKLLENETIDLIYNEYKENKDSIKEHIKEEFIESLKDFCEDTFDIHVDESNKTKDNQKTMSDNIYLKDKNFTKLDSMSGSITVENCIGDTIHTMSGNADVTNSTVNRAETMSGNCHCVKSKIKKLKTMSGNISIQGSTVEEAQSISGRVLISNSKVDTLTCCNIDFGDYVTISNLVITDRIKGNSVVINGLHVPYISADVEYKEPEIVLPYESNIEHITFKTNLKGIVHIHRNSKHIPEVEDGVIKRY